MNSVNSENNAATPLIETQAGLSKCLEVINLILDGEASEEQLSYFDSKIKCCEKSMGYFNLEKCIRDVVKMRIEKKDVSPKLVEEIRSKLNISVNQI